MRGIFCISNASTNEEFKKHIKRRMRVMIAIFIIGMFTMATAIYAYINVEGADYILGLFTGIGSGLMGAAVALWIRWKMVLGDEEKIKRERLKCTDERLVEINHKAFRIASMTLLVTIYIVGLVGSLYSPIFGKLLFGLVTFFLFAYIVAYSVIEKRS